MQFIIVPCCSEFLHSQQLLILLLTSATPLQEPGPALQDDQCPLQLQPHHAHGPGRRHPDTEAHGPAHHPRDGGPGGSRVISD